MLSAERERVLCDRFVVLVGGVVAGLALWGERPWIAPIVLIAIICWICRSENRDSAAAQGGDELERCSGASPAGPSWPPAPDAAPGFLDPRHLVIYCADCGEAMSGSYAQVGDPSLCQVLYLRCRVCRREICVEALGVQRLCGTQSHRGQNPAAGGRETWR